MYSYTSQKIVHDQQIREALERQHSELALEDRERSPLQALRQLFARFNRQPNQQQEECPCCAEYIERLAS